MKKMLVCTQNQYSLTGGFMALTKKAERTKAKLLDSAQRLISAHGFDNVSVEDITKDSGVAKGTFYHYFASKEEAVVGDIPSIAEMDAAQHFLAEGRDVSLLSGLGRLLEAAAGEISDISGRGIGTIAVAGPLNLIMYFPVSL